MGRKKFDSVLDRVNRVRKLAMKMEMGGGVTPDEVVDGFMEAAKVIDELMHRRGLAVEALDIGREVTSRHYIVEFTQEELEAHGI